MSRWAALWLLAVMLGLIVVVWLAPDGTLDRLWH
jgi:hypothetical protein